MKATIYSHKKQIGTVDLQVGDESMGCLFGEFIPNDTYFSDIQKFVWAFWATREPDFKKWNSLRLNARLENGYFLYPVGGYTFDDIPDLRDEPIRIDIVGLQWHVLDDFFLQTPPRPFVEEPWEQISIEQKIGLEDELYREIGLIDKPFFDVFKGTKSKHALADFEFSALCKDGRNDDVLFAIRKRGFDKQFAVIHLTWKGRKEAPNFPGTDFFTDFDEFKYLRMYPDRVEWEE